MVSLLDALWALLDRIANRLFPVDEFANAPDVDPDELDLRERL